MTVPADLTPAGASGNRAAWDGLMSAMASPEGTRA